MHSLAGEHLQVLESMVSLEHQKQEKIVVEAMGTLYQGGAIYSWRKYMDLQYLFSAGLETVRI
jgi:limonene-1,2-epoxide hydrolase